MGTRLAGLLRKELVQLLRDRVVLLLVLYLYTVEAIMCTMALSFEVRDLPFAVIDHDHSVASRKLTHLFDLSDALSLVRQGDSVQPARAWLERGDVGMVLVIPPGFERHYATGLAPTLQVLLDGTNSNVAEHARHYGNVIVRRFESERPPLGPGSVSQGGALPMPRVWFNPTQRTATSMMLSMIALAGMMVGMILPAATIVREKERGTIEQLLVTPVRIGELFLAKTLPTMALNLLALFPALLVATLFEVPLRGSLFALLAMAAVFQLSAISLGVFVATVTRTLQQALLLGFFALFPILFLSGTMTPIESMPPTLQALSLLSPLRHYFEIILGVFLKGAGWADLWPQALALLAIGVPLYAAAMAAFRRRIG
ncbi:MAG TPA: ABC transporter permease [Xanthomonadaceae bacterium]|nr:ABC transporter permease [Xanthomonadaceae bacterium]